MSNNIQDVANRAGVSAYLNKSAPVNEATAKKIKEAIEELRYKPNFIARSLRRKRTICFILEKCIFVLNIPFKKSLIGIIIR